jgi:hypothetical protein
MKSKITRIFFKSLGVISLVIIILLIGLYFSIQSYSFQSWLGKEATKYLSRELNSKIEIGSIQLDFFESATLNKIFILDKHHDTILYGDILIKIKDFDYKNKSITIQKITLKNINSKIIKYKKDVNYNYDFLINYFSSNNKKQTNSKWNIKFDELELNNVSFIYKNENEEIKLGKNINFNNVFLKNTYANISSLKLNNDTIFADIKSLKTKEQSGFELSDFKAITKISSKQLICESLIILTPQTKIEGSIKFYSNNWNDYDNFISKIKLNSYINKSSYLSFKDIAYFASDLNGLEDRVFLSGKINGFINELKLNKFNLTYGKNTRFNGDIAVIGLSKIETSQWQIEAKEISANYNDLILISKYPFNEGKKINLPIELKRLGLISFHGKINGCLSNFSSSGKFSTGLGNVETQIKINKKNNDIEYQGNIKSEHFNLGTLIDNYNYNDLSLDFDINGKSTDIKTIKAIIKGEIINIKYNDYLYKNIKITGEINEKLFNGNVICSDENANFDIYGLINLKNDITEIEIRSNINKLNLNKLNLVINNDTNIISSKIIINVKGKSIDDLTGEINLDKVIYKTKSKIYKLSNLNIISDQGQGLNNIKINSDYFDANLLGEFKISNLKQSFLSFLFKYYPTFFKNPLDSKKNNDEFALNVRIKKFDAIKELFLPDLMISPETRIDANFNAKENIINLKINSSKLIYKSISFNNLSLSLIQNDKSVLAEIKSKSINPIDSLTIENILLKINSIDKSLSYTLDWDNYKKPLNKGGLSGDMAFNKNDVILNINKIFISIKDSSWQLTKPSSLNFSKTEGLKISPLEIKNNNQLINIYGNISENNNDSVLFRLDNIFLEQFNPILKLFKIKLFGDLNGKFALTNYQNKLAYSGQLDITKLIANDNQIGELFLKSNYFIQENKIALNGYTSLGFINENGIKQKNILFVGDYFLDKNDESIDIDFIAKPANINMLNPLLQGILTIKNGYINGNGKIHGTPNKIKIDGKLKIFNSEVKIDYTNVIYNITGEIDIMSDQIRFTDLLLREKGTKAAPQGTLNGNIFHSNFKEMRIDYDVAYKNMLLLNTTKNENNLFYGKLYGTGNMSLFGNLNDIYMKINNTTNKNSKFILPLDGPLEIEEDNRIHFVQKDSVKIKTQKISGFNLEIDLHVTPDVLTQILLDQTNGDKLNVQGNGDLKININTLGKFEMKGDYILSGGDYLFTLESVINKKFDIASGSQISWSGDPLNADINVITVYKQRASISTLLNDTTNKSRIPVDCKLNINGKLFSPNIKFALDFPLIDATSKARIDNVLSDEAELNRQVFSFLLFKSFIKPQIYNLSGGGVTAGNAAASTSSEMLSNRVSEFLNSYVKNLTGIDNLQLGLNYRPANKNNNETVDIAVSKQFMNDKITIDGNFGLNNNSNSNNLIGDVNINYKLTDDGKYRLKGFNRSNDNTQITTAGGPYTQGVGILYKKEFNKLFFLKKLNKKTAK